MIAPHSVPRLVCALHETLELGAIGLLTEIGVAIDQLLCARSLEVAFPVEPRRIELLHDQAAAGMTAGAAPRLPGGPLEHVLGVAEEVDLVSGGLVEVVDPGDLIERHDLDPLW